MVSFRDFIQAFRELDLNPHCPIIVHASVSSIGKIRGGADTLLSALLQSTAGVMAPTFTYRTMILPEAGPPDNAVRYGSGRHSNQRAEFFLPDMPADRLMGILPELLRRHPNARRSMHPILSFAGVGVEQALAAQTLENHLAPIQVLEGHNANVLLIGVDHTSNTSIHYAERCSGRKQFMRWGLTPQGVRACPSFSGCSDGFEAAAPLLQHVTRTARVGGATLRAVPLAQQTQILVELLRRDPLALLCDRNDERCAAVRAAVHAARIDQPGPVPPL